MTTFLILALCVVVLWAGNKALDRLHKSLIAATTQKNGFCRLRWS
jgi:hypothetical protein